MDTVEHLEEIAARHGAVLGVTDCAPFRDVAATMMSRMDDGTSAGLTFTYKDPEMATEPARSFPWGRSIVVVAMAYLVDGDGPGPRSVARFADGDRYASLHELLTELVTHLEGGGWRGEPVVDDDRLIDRAAAVRAGVGWWGRSTMVLTPGAGPWILLGEVVTDAVLPVSEPMRRTCGTCDACIPACPTGAISASGSLDARRCLAAIFQARPDIPPELRRAAGGRIYGCDDCLTACPPGVRAFTSMAPPVTGLSPEEVLVMSDDELDGVVEHWYVPGRKMRFVRRNALVALGNTGGPGAGDLLRRYIEHEDAMLVRHALWAIEELERRLAPGSTD